MEYIKEKNRIYANDASGKLIAEVTFPDCGENTVVIDHTFVDDSLRGQGVAAELMEAAYSAIKSSGKVATLTCSYAVKWFEKNKKKNDILVSK